MKNLLLAPTEPNILRVIIRDSIGEQEHVIVDTLVYCLRSLASNLMLV
jgi:hypothetical protein